MTPVAPASMIRMAVLLSSGDGGQVPLPYRHAMAAAGPGRHSKVALPGGVPRGPGPLSRYYPR